MQPLRRRPQGDGHLQCPNRQVAFHAVADRPADDTPGMQVEDDRQIQPPLAGPDVTDITRPFLVGFLSDEVLLQQVRRDVNRLLKKVFWSRSAGKIFLYGAISCRKRGITNRSQKVFPLSGAMIWSSLSFSAAC